MAAILATKLLSAMSSSPPSPSSSPSLDRSWCALRDHANSDEISKAHLSDLLKDEERYRSLTAQHEDLFLDFSRQRVTAVTMDLLFDLAKNAKVADKIKAMAAGDKINTTENRAVMHMALRANKGDVFKVDDKDVVPEVVAVRDQIKEFAKKVRSGVWKGITGKALTDVVAIGIGGSFLGAKFVSEALKVEPSAQKSAKGRRLRFLANVDPVDVARALDGLVPETTLVVVISKTFTTAETMLNAKTCRNWLVQSLGEKAVPLHMIACSTATELVKKFGIDPLNDFPFWDWVGGRFSVCSAVGLMPLSLQFGPEVVDQFLAGARSMDLNFLNANPRQNLPLIMGLLGVWNSSFLNYPARAIACYSEAMLDFANHIQQVDMESNGKRVKLDGTPLPAGLGGEINFGTPGTNGQHSFFQLFHQGRVVPVDFIGFMESQHEVELKGEAVSNHDELMCNFFAQPDALACGQNEEELKSLKCPEGIIPHKKMPGNRPSSVLLLPSLTAYTTGQLLSLYEHRTAVQGFVWGINSFDQFGVELGKVLATTVRKTISQAKVSLNDKEDVLKVLEGIKGYSPSTSELLKKYIQHKAKK